MERSATIQSFKHSGANELMKSKDRIYAFEWVWNILIRIYQIYNEMDNPIIRILIILYWKRYQNGLPSKQSQLISSIEAKAKWKGLCGSSRIWFGNEFQSPYNNTFTIHVMDFDDITEDWEKIQMARSKVSRGEEGRTLEFFPKLRRCWISCNRLVIENRCLAR